MARVALRGARQMVCGFALGAEILAGVAAGAIGRRGRHVVVFRTNERGISGGESGRVAHIALCRGRNVGRRFCHHAELYAMARVADPGNRGGRVIEACAKERRGAEMACLARCSGRDVQRLRRLAHDVTAELAAMAQRAAARDAGVVHVPAGERGRVGVAGLARGGGGEVPGGFAHDACILSVVARRTPAGDADMVEALYEKTGRADMAGVASLVRLHVIGGLRSGAHAASRRMAAGAVSRRILEDAVHMTLFASQGGMDVSQQEAGACVIE